MKKTLPSSHKISSLFKQGDISILLSLSSQEGFFQIKNAVGFNPLHLACLYGYAQLIEPFLQAGADINCTSNNAQTPLHVAIFNGKKTVFDLLIKNKADIFSLTKSQDTPLHLASKKSNSFMIHTLIKNGADMYTKNIRGETPCHISYVKDTKTLQAFIDNGIDVNNQDSSGNTFLHSACADGSIEFVNLLLDNNSNVNIKNNYGLTPLHLICANIVVSDTNHLQIAQKLLSKNLNIDDISADGDTALHFATDTAYVNMVELLLSNKCNINIKNSDGFTALDLATNNPEIMNLIQTYQNYYELNESLLSINQAHSIKKIKL